MLNLDVLRGLGRIFSRVGLAAGEEISKNFPKKR
jgi:hypothetical protein